MNVDDLQELLEDVAARHQVVGAGVCVLADGQERTATIGVQRLGAPGGVSEQTRFALASTTKPLTAFMTAQLVAEGLLGFDDRYVDHMPGFRGCGDGAGEITVRQLLSHTSGIADDFRSLDGPSDLFALLAAAEPVDSPGRIFSYSNLGYALLGHLVERLTGQTWEANLTSRLLQPLGLDASALTADTLGRDVAVEHRRHPDSGRLEVGDAWPRVGRGMAAAGSTLHASPGDVARLVWTCLTGRNAACPDTEPLLPASLITEMQRAHTTVPGLGITESGWALGWAIEDGDPRRPVTRHLLGHRGGTSALVHADPHDGTVFVSLTNYAGGELLGRELARVVFGGPCGPLLRPKGPVCGLGLGRFAGMYRTPTFSMTVRSGTDGLLVTNPLTGGEVTAHHLDGDVFYADLGELTTPLVFLDPDAQGRPQRLHGALRVLKRDDDVSTPQQQGAVLGPAPHGDAEVLVLTPARARRRAS